MPDQSKVLVTRDLIFYYKVSASGNALPADTVEWGTAWSTWTDGGYTQGGLGFNAEISRGEVRMDQSLDPVARPATGRTVTMTANLGEFDLASLVTATGQGSVSTTAPSSGVRGHTDWTMGQTVADNYYSVAFDILHQGDDEAVRVAGWHTQPTGAQQWTFGPENAALTPFVVSLFPDPNGSGRVATIRDIIEAAA